MPDRRPRPDRETPHKEKLCKTCGKPFSWQPEKDRDWVAMKYCSDACRGYAPAEKDEALECAILDLLADRGPGKSICPSEAAKLVGGTEHRRDWEALMEPARAVARRLVAAGRIVITQRGRVVNPATAKGPIRLQLR